MPTKVTFDHHAFLIELDKSELIEHIQAIERAQEVESQCVDEGTGDPTYLTALQALHRQAVAWWNHLFPKEAR